MEKKDNNFIPVLVDFIPLLLFLIANKTYGLMVATAVLIVATPISAYISYKVKKEIPYVPIITAFFVIIFGGLTLYMNNEIFIKIKPTAVNILFAIILLIGLLLKKNFLQLVLGKTFVLPDKVWINLNIVWAVFFIVLAIINEIVWRNFSTEFWVSFKVFGFSVISLVFTSVIMIWLYPYIKDNNK